MEVCAGMGTDGLIANGALREAWYGKHMSEVQAHQASTATGVLLFGIYIWVLIHIWRPVSSGQGDDYRSGVARDNGCCGIYVGMT